MKLDKLATASILKEICRYESIYRRGTQEWLARMFMVGRGAVT